MPEFDLAKLMQDVSKADTGKQQIRYIPLELIDPDPDNFYSLDGLNELAGSIEMLGLQQPLLVRPATGGRYVVISGHRRRAALMLIRDGGSAQFADGVPCIVDASTASDALRELKLIMANADTRKMSSADQSKQAERIEDLLRQLEDEGFEFPGRLRDWVSKLSGMSRTKLARLKVIRDKLDRSVKKNYYDKGKLKEDAAYELARLPDHVQRATVAWLKAQGKKTEYWYSSTITQYGEDLQRVAGYTCPAKYGGKPCVNQQFIMERIWNTGYHRYCHCANGKKCCANCDDLASCSQVCGYLTPKAEKLKQEKRQKNKEIKDAEKQAQQSLVDRIRLIWLRFGNALSRANMEDEDLRKMTGDKIYQLDAERVAALEAGEDTRLKAGTVLPFFNSCYLSDVDRYIKAADALGCSIDYLFCRTDAPEVNTRLQTAGKREVSVRFLGWLTGTAPDGVKCWAKFMDDDSRDFCMMATYDAYADAWYCGESLSELSEIEQTCIGWWPLPDDNAPDLPGDLTPQRVSDSDAAPAWHTGEPEKEGWYAVRGYWYEEKTQERLVMYYRSGKWYEDSKCRRVITDTTVTRWFPLPEEDVE